jgi:hypothetical protein
MTQRLDPPGPARARRGDSQTPATPEQRVFPRIKFSRNIELTCGDNKYPGQTYDISQGGLSFIAAEAIAVDLAAIRISEAYTFQGRILAKHDAGKPGYARFHLQFITSLELATLAGILGS